MKKTPAKTAPTLADEILTTRELADYLHCHPTTIYRMLRDGTIPVFRIGGMWRFNRAAIDQWMERSTVGRKQIR